jgi:hypothetical protein
MPTPSSGRQLLLIGASRGLGFALTEEYLKRGWRVVATERAKNSSRLHTLVEAFGGRLEIETVDVNHPDQVAALRARIAARKFDLPFVNAGVKNDDRETIADVSTDEFIRVMVTNALSPMRSLAARHAHDPRALLLLAPGWVRTDMGGPEARLSIEESIPNLANTIDAQAGKAGLQYLDHLGRKVPW